MSLYLGNNLVSGVVTPIEPSRNIGQIIQSTIPLTDAGLHLLDGSLIQGSGIYSAFVDYIAGLVSTYPSVFTTESNWQSSITTYGVCGKFVYDSVNNTVRLPKYNSKIYTGGGTAPVIGNGITLGVTNGTNDYATIAYPNPPYFYGMLSLGTPAGSTIGTNITDASAPSGRYAFGVSTDPAKSGIIADLSNITTSLDGYYYIVIATSTKTDIEVDIDEVVTDLNGKADTDLSNVPTSKGILTESYVNGTSWYRVYSDGWCEQGGFCDGNGYTQTVLLKNYKDTSYIVTLSFNNNINSPADGQFSGMYLQAYNKTTSSFYSYCNASNSKWGTAWRACGYIN